MGFMIGTAQGIKGYLTETIKMMLESKIERWGLVDGGAAEQPIDQEGSLAGGATRAPTLGVAWLGLISGCALL